MPKLIILIILMFFLGAIITVHAAWPVEEATLNPAGEAFEVNPDVDGWLWISDLSAGEVWRVNPSTSPAGYTKYVIEYTKDLSLGFPSDARRSGDFFWWVDGYSNLIGRAAVVDGSYWLWEVPGAQTFYGTAIDSSGRLWASEWPAISTEGGIPHIVSVTVTAEDGSSNICIFTLPEGGGTSYMAYDHPYLWMGDEVNFRILRLDVNDYSLKSWDLPVGSTILSLAVDDDGDLWFADYYDLVEFDPEPNLLTSYRIPKIGAPQMVAVEGNRVWYSGLAGLNPAIGMVNTLFAAHEIPKSLILNDMGTLNPECNLSIVPISSGNLAMVSGSTGWSEANFQTLQNSAGWFILQMPENADPRGITSGGEFGYVVDRGRQMLLKIPVPVDSIYNVFLPLILR